MHHFKLGVHYESVRYDLSDLPSRTYQLIQEAKSDASRLERMGAAALEQALRYVSQEALIDSVAWVLGRIKEANPWEVRHPDEEQGWVLHRFPGSWSAVHPWPSGVEDKLRGAFPYYWRKPDNAEAPIGGDLDGDGGQGRSKGAHPNRGGLTEWLMRTCEHAATQPLGKCRAQPVDDGM
jgi:hypothetical protein